MTKKVKPKTAKKPKAESKPRALKSPSKRSGAGKSELPELVTVMMKVVERLEALERKIDLVISQTSGRPSAAPQAQGQQSVQRPEQPQQRHPHPPNGSHPIHGQNGSQQNHGQNRRPLYKAVCADCRKDCEIPFKPTGERPVYCKECFAGRKAGNSAPKGNSRRDPVPPHLGQRKIINKTGRVTVSQIVTSSANHGYQKERKHKPGKHFQRA